MSNQPKKPSVVYEEIVDIVYDYLGPASKRFVTNLAKSHLNKTPSQITRDDIAILHEWGVKAFALVASNDRMIKEFSTRLLGLQNK